LVGYVTDRDLVVRGLAEGFSADTHIHDVMTDKVLYCFEDEEVEEVAVNMADNQVRRLPCAFQGEAPRRDRGPGRPRHQG
jgi:CBS domain-containing protein